jgi:glycosyltransferase involved in cell wall biosynthesis
MKILLSTDTLGGVWDHTVTLARELDAAGHEVLVAAIGEVRDERLAHLSAGVQVASRSYRLEWMSGAEADVPAAAAWLRGLASVWGADVVHLNQMAYAAFGFPAPVLAAVHSDVLSWWTHVLGTEAPMPEWARYAAWVRDGLRAADAVAAPTAYQAALLARHYGVEGASVVHNGVELAPGEPEPRTAFSALSVGRLWDRGKGVDVLDEAAGLLGPDFPAIHALGESTAPHGERFEPRHLRAPGRVERAEVDAWMRRASVYVATSRYEPFGLAPLEAALHGCALVLSDVGTFRELWDGCAEFVPVGDAPALAAVLRALRDDPARVARLAAGARKRALRRYTSGRMAGEYIDLYRRLVQRHALRDRAQTASHPTP